MEQSKSELLGALYHYRDRLIHEFGKPGWSKWALYGAIAGMIWLMFGMIQDPRIVVQDGVPILLILYLASPLLRFLPEVGRKKETSKRVYLSLRQEWNEGIYSSLFNVTCLIGTLVYTNSFLFLEHWTQVMLDCYVGMILVLLLLMFMVSRTEAHAPDVEGDTTKFVRIMKNVGLLILLVCAGTSIWGIAGTITTWKSIVMWESGVLLFGVYYVLHKLVEEYEGNPLLDTVEHLIDEVMFDKINIADANHKLRIIWLGAEFKDVIDPDIARFMDANERYQSLIIKAQRRCEEYLISKEEEREQMALSIIDDVNEINIQEQALKVIIEKIKKKLIYYYILEWGTEDYQNVTKTLNEEVQKSHEAAMKLRDFGEVLNAKEAEWRSQKNTEHRGGKRRKKGKAKRNKHPDFKNN